MNLGRTMMLAALLMATFSIAACSGSGAGTVGEEAADFGVTTLEGDEFRLAEKRGEVVALYFMAAY